MKSEEVKYVYQPGAGPLLVPKNVYEQTTISNNNDVHGRCWPSHLFSRLRIVLSCLAILACIIVIAILMINGIKASNERELDQEKEISQLKELVDNQQGRLHRMQKELQFLVARQKAYEAREESLRRQPPYPSSLGTGTRSNIWPSPSDRVLPSNIDEEEADTDLPIAPRAAETVSSVLDEEVEVEKLPRASPNKKRKGKLMEELPEQA